ncbi:hypothetical protein cypCar_00014295 [Cyprinus carpio]|nr:hypothetical protein cypCar_00014295 [Cyprinus carpio]
MYVARNCSGGPTNYIGVLCNPCRRCEGKLRRITLYGSSSVIAAIFILTVIVAACFFCRIRKSGESNESSAGEPFHISI